MGLNVQSGISKSSHVKFDVQDKNALLPIGFDTRAFKGDTYFWSKNNAKEYLLLNYLLVKHPYLIAELFNNMPISEEEADASIYTFNDMLSFAIIEWDDYKKSKKWIHTTYCSLTLKMHLYYTHVTKMEMDPLIKHIGNQLKI